MNFIFNFLNEDSHMKKVRVDLLALVWINKSKRNETTQTGWLENWIILNLLHWQNSKMKQLLDQLRQFFHVSYDDYLSISTCIACYVVLKSKKKKFKITFCEKQHQKRLSFFIHIKNGYHFSSTSKAVFIFHPHQKRLSFFIRISKLLIT